MTEPRTPQSPLNDNPDKTSRVLVLHPDYERRDATSRRTPESRLAEAEGLTEAIHLNVVHACVVPLRAVRPATLFGTGKLEELKSLIGALDIGLVVINAAISPGQQRNLEEFWNTKVLDRTGLILEIFGERATTKEGRLQVELAHLNYQKTRLVRSWTHLERQRGGMGFLGGPGETQIESDRRQISERIVKIKAELELVRRTRALHRKARKRVPYPVIALVGYTNAGKSSLFNALTDAEVFAKDLLFATLDPTMRVTKLASNVNVILSDTVGFISELPTDLIAAFRATLEEVIEADLIVHVRDIAHPETDDQRKDVLDVLSSMGIDVAHADSRIIEVWNKIDLLPENIRQTLKQRADRPDNDGVVALSARTGEGLDKLKAELAQTLARQRNHIELTLRPEEGELLAWLYARANNIESHQQQDGSIRISAALGPEDMGRLANRLSADPRRLSLPETRR